MKTKLSVITTLATVLGIAANAFAATGAREDSSMILVWAFLGMCALIVIVQLMPVMFMAFGMIRGIVKGGKESQVSAQAASKD